MATLTILAFLLAVVALAWQGYESWANHATRLTVSISESASKYGNRAFLTVRNRGRRPVRIVTAGFELPGAPRPSGENGKPMVFQIQSDGGSFDPIEATYPPQLIEPGDSWTTVIFRDVIESHLGRPPVVTAFACAADGKDFVSRPTELWGERWEQQIAEIDEADRRL